MQLRSAGSRAQAWRTGLRPPPPAARAFSREWQQRVHRPQSPCNLERHGSGPGLRPGTQRKIWSATVSPPDAPSLTTSPVCPCGCSALATLLVYHAAPPGENPLPGCAAGPYYREFRRCPVCGHFSAAHDRDLSALYQGDYVNSVYADLKGLRCAFERINALAPGQSDNHGRVRRVVAFARDFFPSGAFAARRPTLLDVGSGLCVFPHRMRLEGWECTALDPDPRVVRHAVECAEVRGQCGDFLSCSANGKYDLLTFNKVLEHVLDPVAMLARALDWTREGGLIYLEVPDGERAITEGAGREEFFIEHHHAFSAASLAIVAARAGLCLLAMERLQEPSSKFTLRAFAIAQAHCRATRAIETVTAQAGN